MKLLYRFINYFGLLSGIKLFLQFKFNQLSSIQLPGYQHPFQLRVNTTDIPMFYQVFFNQCYNINFDIVPKVIIDAGANIGLASIYFANRFKESRIISLEPESNNFKLLTKNSKLYTNITPINYALWNETDELIVEDQGLGSSGFKVKKEANQGHLQKVKSITIDQLFLQYKLDIIDVLKIDIEGSEKEIFDSNYENWLNKIRYLIIETHDFLRPGTSKSVFKAISKYDFHLEIRGENLIFINQNLL